MTTWFMSAMAFCLVITPWAGAQPAGAPPTIVWDGDHLLAVKRRVSQQQATAQEAEALGRLRTAADEALKHQPYSVTAKRRVAPSGDIHDYQSFSRYWWPDSSQPDGLPYIRRDGKVNHALLRQGDRQPLGALMDDVQVLGLAGYLLDDPRCAAHASRMIKVWFLDEETRMNPHLNFGQGVPGRAEGRGVGIIDTRGFAWILDAAELLDERAEWTDQDHDRLCQWFRRYLDWLVHSELGQDEREAGNNHGSWYDVQVARYAILLEDMDLAAAAFDRGRSRIDHQFDASGRQAAELKRTRSLHYSFFNLSALMVLARIGSHVDVDLWRHQPAHGCGIRGGLDFLLPFAQGARPWDYPVMGPFALGRVTHMTMRFASHTYGDPKYAQLAEEVPVRHGETDFAVLLAPRQFGD